MQKQTCPAGFPSDGFKDNVGGFHKDNEGIAPNGHACSPCYSSTCDTCPSWWFMQRRDSAMELVRERKERENHKETFFEIMCRIKSKILFTILAVILGTSMLLLSLVSSSSMIGILAFVAAVATFGVMSYEDAKSKTVDVQKAAFLSAAFLLCSMQGVAEYLFLLVFYLLFFHILLSALGIFATLSLSKPKARRVKRPAFSGRAAITKGGVPFLPCFMGGIIASCLASILSHESIPAVAAYYADKLFDLNALVISASWKPTLLGSMLAVLILLKGAEWLLCDEYAKVSVLGEGDALVLPVFGAFLGTPLFFSSLGFGFLVAFLCISAKKENGDPAVQAS